MGEDTVGVFLRILGAVAEVGNPQLSHSYVLRYLPAGSVILGVETRVEGLSTRDLDPGQISIQGFPHPTGKHLRGKRFL